MKTSDLIRKTEDIARAKGKFDKLSICSLVHLSSNTYQEMVTDSWQKEGFNPSKRQMRALATSIAKVCIFVDVDPHEQIRETFPTASELDVQYAVKCAQDAMGDNAGELNTLLEDDLEFLRGMITNTTKPITFKDAYDLLCKFRSRV